MLNRYIRSVVVLFCLQSTFVLVPLHTVYAQQLLGVVVEEPRWASPQKESDLQPGDVLFSWERLPTPPANPEGDRGDLVSPFDWHWLLVEQAPRGVIKIIGERGGKPLVFEESLESWEGKVRPRMSATVLALYGKGKERVKREEFAEGIDFWREIYKIAKDTNDQQLSSWISLRIGQVWAKAGNWGQNHVAYESALEEAPRPRVSIALLHAMGEANEQQQHFEEAAVSYRTALDLGRATWGDSMTVARAQTSLGRVAWERRQVSVAASHWQRAFEIRKMLAPRSVAFAQSLNNLGFATGDSDLDTTADYFEKALEILEEQRPESLEVAESLNGLGIVALRQSELDIAGAYLERAVKIQEVLAPVSRSMARNLNSLGVLAKARGDLDTATARLEGALEIYRKLALNNLDVAQSLVNLGSVAVDRGCFATANEHLKEALKIYEKRAPTSEGIAVTLHNLGYLAHKRGDLVEATGYLERALEIHESGPDSPTMAITLNNLGAVAGERGNLHKAEKYFKQALAIKEKLTPDSLTITTTLNSLGTLARERGEPGDAEEYFLKAYSLSKALKPDTAYVALSLNNLGDVAAERGQLDAAADYYRKALKINEKIAPQSQETAKNLNSLAEVTTDGAAEYFTRALHILEELAPKSMWYADSLNGLGHLARENNQHQIAADYFDRALNVLEAQIGRFGGSQGLKANFRARRRSIYRDAIRQRFALDQPVVAFHNLERSRARSFLDILAERELRFSADVPEELEKARRSIDVNYDRNLVQLDALSDEQEQEREEIEKEQGRLRQEREEIATKILEASPRFAALQYPQPLTFAEAREALDPGTVMLSYSVGEEDTDLFVLRRDQALQVHTLAIGEEELRQKIERFHCLVTKEIKSNTDREDITKILTDLYPILVDPAATEIDKGERVVVVPDGPLHLLPFNALVRELGGGEEKTRQYLVEWKPLHSVISATVYAQLVQARTQGKPPPAQTQVELVAFGDPHYPASLKTQKLATISDVRVRSMSEQGLFDWDPLPYSRREVEEIARLFTAKNVQIYLGEEATEERVKALDQKARVLHFATHGYLDQRSPLDSGLALTIPETLTDDRENGILQMWEILESVRIDADLVVLSACDSGLGHEQGGEGLIGLTRAFLYAGAHSVAATLWKVEDRATAELMKRFYRYLRAGKPKDEALRAAQMELIRGPIEVTDESGRLVKSEVSAPYYWAAFQIFGDWQ